MDFKGHVAMDRGRCHPLTVLDDHSGHAPGLVACCDETPETVQHHLTGIFRRHGLPLGILCDNGSPWGGSGAVGPAAFEVWPMRTGVRVHRGRRQSKTDLTLASDNQREHHDFVAITKRHPDCR